MDQTPKPSNHLERKIAEAFDGKMLVPGSTYESIVAEIVISMAYELSMADFHFLFNYADWKLDQPVKKQTRPAIALAELKRSG